MSDQQNRLGTALVNAKLITNEQLQMAVDFQKAVGGKLGAIIVKLGFIEEETLTRHIARQAGLPVINLHELVLPENLVKRIPRKLIEKHHVIPIHYKDGVLAVATSDPYDFEAIEELQLAQDSRIEINLAPRSMILRCISTLFDDDAPAPPRPEPARTATADPRKAVEKLSKAQQIEALVPLLLEKGVITHDDLVRKAKELEGKER